MDESEWEEPVRRGLHAAPVADSVQEQDTSTATVSRKDTKDPAVYNGFLGWCAALLVDMGCFTKTYAPSLIASAAVILATFGRLLFSDNIGIDTEMMVNTPGTILNWYSIGREGMVFSKTVLGTLSFNMYLAQVLGMAFFLLAVWMWCFLLHRLGARRKATFVAFPVIFATHPIFVEQFYFTTQMAEFNLAMVTVPLALLLVVESASMKSVASKIVGCLAAASLMFWAFASYQSFLALVLAGGCLTGLMLARHPERLSDPDSISAAKRRFIRIAVSFAIAYVLATATYLIVTHLWYSSSTYLTKQILWGKLSFMGCVRKLLGVIRDMAIGEHVFYTPAFVIGAVLLLWRIGADFASRRRKGFVFASILLTLLMLVSPFLLPAVMAAMPAARTAFTLPFVVAACVVLFWEGMRVSWPAVAIQRVVIVALCVVIGGWQVSTSLRLLYTDDVAYQQSVEFASMVCHDIDALVKSDKDKAVVFIGCWDPELNNACLKGEYIGVSEFHWGDASLPHYHRSSEIVLNWLEAIGHTYTRPSEDQVIEARKIAKDLPLYPKTGELYDAGDFVIVKLGPDLFYSQDIEPLLVEPTFDPGPEGLPPVEEE